MVAIRNRQMRSLPISSQLIAACCIGLIVLVLDSNYLVSVRIPFWWGDKFIHLLSGLALGLGIGTIVSPMATVAIVFGLALGWEWIEFTYGFLGHSSPGLFREDTIADIAFGLNGAFVSAMYRINNRAEE